MQLPAQANKTKHPIHLLPSFLNSPAWKADDGAMGAIAAFGGMNEAAITCCFHPDRHVGLVANFP